MVKLVSKNRSGLLPEHHGLAPITYDARATIPVVEALRDAGANVVALPAPAHGYRITLGSMMPSGIIAVHLNATPWLGLRLAIEPEYPGEHPDYWQQVDFTPCPKCGAPVVWYEAGFAPGYRVCAGREHHHLIAQ